eukprot:844971-Heterocapsa_arctica.AAC.1
MRPTPPVSVSGGPDVSDVDEVQLRFGGPPPPVVVPAYIVAMAVNADTNDHLLKWYLKLEGDYTTEKGGGRHINTMTTTEVMNMRVFWLGDI